MLFLREPLTADIRDFIQSQVPEPFSYRETGATRANERPHGYAIDKRRILLGHGQESYLRARKALQDWRQFGLGWVQLCWPYKRLQPGVVVAVLVGHYGFWSLNAARIVYVVDELEPVRRYGFAYGTLRDHLETGEERFSVEWRADDSVWFEISSFSRPSHWLVWAFYPLARASQQRFLRQAVRAMHLAVNQSAPAALSAPRTANAGV
jgi:uncharacterized protein (UPF0548 family)